LALLVEEFSKPPSYCIS